MMARAVLLALALALLGASCAAPTAAASDPCVVGSSEPGCAVSVQIRECVTDPCDTMDLCVAYGRLCLA